MGYRLHRLRSADLIRVGDAVHCATSVVSTFGIFLNSNNAVSILFNISQEILLGQMAVTPQAPRRLKDWQVVLYTVLLPVSAAVFIMGLLGIMVLSGTSLAWFLGSPTVANVSSTVCTDMTFLKPWWSGQTINRRSGLAGHRLRNTCGILSPSTQVRNMLVDPHF